MCQAFHIFLFNNPHSTLIKTKGFKRVPSLFSWVGQLQYEIIILTYLWGHHEDYWVTSLGEIWAKDFISKGRTSCCQTHSTENFILVIKLSHSILYAKTYSLFWCYHIANCLTPTWSLAIAGRVWEMQSIITPGCRVIWTTCYVRNNICLQLPFSASAPNFAIYRSTLTLFLPYTSLLRQAHNTVPFTIICTRFFKEGFIIHAIQTFITNFCNHQWFDLPRNYDLGH